MRKAYQSDLSDAEWSFLEPLMPLPAATGRPRMHTTREILNAMFYIASAAAAPGAVAAARLPAVEDHLPLLPLLAPGRHLGERVHSALRQQRVRVRLLEAGPSAQRRHSGQPVGEDDRRGRRRRARLRWRQKGEGQKTPHLLVDTQGLWCSKLGSTARK